MSLFLSDILADPDLAGQPFLLRRRSRSVGDDGRSAVTAVDLPMQGSIQPAPAREVARLPEEDRHLSAVQVFTAAPLHAGGPGHAPDVVIWRGGSYTVRSVKDWSGFGGPHFEALAVLLPVEGEPPP